jgi:endoglucanase
MLVGEFGGELVDLNTNEGLWQQALVKYLKDNRIGYTYFCLNPNSADTGGVLEDDFTTVRKDKMDLLRTHLAPRLEEPARG